MTDYIGETAVLPTPEPTREELSIQMNTLQREIERLNRYVEIANDLERKIGNATGVISDYVSMNGEITDELKEIAEYLDFALTKEINGTATIEISWTATVPMEFDASDLEISYSIECESYDAEDFDYNEDGMSVEGEDS